jgi:hypothetical protein
VECQWCQQYHVGAFLIPGSTTGRALLMLHFESLKSKSQEYRRRSITR